MKRFLLLVCTVVLAAASSFAEKPMVMCPFCQGTGQFMFGYMSAPCTNCKGTGKIVDPYYQGKTMMEGINACSKGKQKLYEGDYSGAVDAFREAYRADNYEAATYLGFCAELGMGLAVDHELAWDLYNYAGSHGDIAGKGAIARINEDGYWPATDDMRRTFRVYLGYVLEEQGMSTSGNFDGGYSGGSSQSGNSGYSLSYFQNAYSRWESVAKSAYDSLTTLGYSVKRNNRDIEGGAMGTWGASNFSSMKRNMRAAQREMRNVRNEARRHGYNIPMSNYENIDVNF